MVRNMVGTLIDCGLKKLPEDAPKTILESKNRTVRGYLYKNDLAIGFVELKYTIREKNSSSINRRDNSKRKKSQRNVS